MFTVRYGLDVYMQLRVLFVLKGRAMAQAVSRRPVTAEDRFRFQANACEICGGQSGIRRGFSAST